MDAQHTTLFKLLDGSKQYRIPQYQRLYSWDRVHCERLFRDIERLAVSLDTGKSHFIGSIVYISKSTKAAGTNQFLVIDGQQRLTTISLLILAMLSDPNFEAVTGQTKVAQLNRYIRNNDEGRESPLFPKLVLTRTDNDHFQEVMSAVEEGRMFSANNRLKRNFDFLRSLIQESETPTDLIWQAIGQLDLVYISLNAASDNPQAIFESLNSTGKDLSQTDLIRNFLLMGHDEDTQIRLYQNYWLPIEGLFRDRQDSEFDDFTRAYVATKLGAFPRKTEVFREFKNFVESQVGAGVSPDDQLDDLLNYANNYASINFGPHPDKNLEQSLKRLRALRIRSLNPLLMIFLDSKSVLPMPVDLVAKSASLIESYLIRRLFAGLGNNALDNTFSTILSSMNDSEFEGLERLEEALLGLKGKARFPRNAEVIQKGSLMDLYSSPLRHFVLKGIEMGLDPKGIGLSVDLTIEHVMPQKLSTDWLRELGADAEAIHARLVHTIGNLTLTPYNSELGNMSFTKKKTALVSGLDKAKIAMTQSVIEQEHWGEAEILARAEKLMALAVKIWKEPELLQKESFVDTSYFGSAEDIQMTDLLAAGAIEPGTRLVWHRSNLDKTHEAVVQEDGSIRVADGDVYADPSPAAMHFSGSSVNGWKAWRVGVIEGESLADLRQVLLDATEWLPDPEF